jgi:glycosyltransferase involved in cell wall biosynthesis
LIAINTYIHKLLVKRGHKNVFTIYHALDPLFVSRRTRQQEREALRIGSDKMVLYVSYLGYTKGAQYLADVALSLPDFMFVVIGTGPLEKSLRGMGLKNLTILGHQPPKVVRQYFRASDIVLYLLTRHGGFGRIGVEAMANEVPVVAFNVRGMDDLVHKDTGVLVRLSDTKGLSKALEYLMEDRSLRVKMGKKGKADVMKKFTVETAAGKLLDAYRVVSGGH